MSKNGKNGGEICGNCQNHTKERCPFFGLVKAETKVSSKKCNNFKPRK